MCVGMGLSGLGNQCRALGDRIATVVHNITAMREDMAKVLVECRRLGGNIKEPKGYRRALQRQDSECPPTREGMRRKWQRSMHGKHLNENLAPLQRFLRSNIGWPWNKVFSEICRHVRLDSAVQKHIRDHLKDFVAEHVQIVNGALQLKTAHYRPTLEVWQPFYVHPKSGLLRENIRRWKVRRQAHRPAFVQITENKQVRMIDGLWFELTLEPAPRRQPDRALAWDVFRKACVLLLTDAALYRTYGRAVYAISKRQLNSREIARLRDRLDALEPS